MTLTRFFTLSAQDGPLSRAEFHNFVQPTDSAIKLRCLNLEVFFSCKALSSFSMFSFVSLSAQRLIVGLEALRICDVKSDLHFPSNSLHSLTRLSASALSTTAEKAW